MISYYGVGLYSNNVYVFVVVVFVYIFCELSIGEFGYWVGNGDVFRVYVIGGIVGNDDNCLRIIWWFDN